MKKQILTTKKENKGITLIALVITIIVLLILAGISIATLTGENGILTKTTEASDKTAIGKEKEIINLSLLASKDNDGNLNKEEFEKELKSYAGDNVELEGEGPFLVRFLDSKREYDVDEKSEVTQALEKTKDDTENYIVGEGTEENPYKIQSIEDLVILSQSVNNGEDTYIDKIFKLDCDLDFKSRNSYINPDKIGWGDINSNEIEEKLIIELTTEKGFIPIAYDYATNFSGTFDGQGHKIRNLYGRGFINNATNINICNLNLENENLPNGSDGFQGSGGIVSMVRGGNNSILNCSVSGMIKGQNFVGGLVGVVSEAGITMRKCENSTTITGVTYVGGLIGCLQSYNTLITECGNFGSVTANGHYVGGIVGEFGGRDGYETEVSNCINDAEIIGISYVGGIIGESYTKNLKISRCANHATIRSQQRVGGIIGQSYNLPIEECYNTGTIEGETYAAGGIIGQAGGQKISDCYNIATIKAEGGTYVSGIAGYRKWCI